MTNRKQKRYIQLIDDTAPRHVSHEENDIFFESIVRRSCSDVQDLTNMESVWCAFLDKIVNNGDVAAEFTFAYLNVKTEHFDTDKTELAAFVRRLLQKKPEFSDRARDLIE